MLGQVLEEDVVLVREDHEEMPVMRLASHVMKLVKPSIARQIRAAVVMNTTDMTFDPASTRFPALTRTAIADVVRRDYQ